MDDHTTLARDNTDQPHTIRLQVYISRAGISSRRSAAQLIESGKVTVNNTVVVTPGHRVDPKQDTVFVNNMRCQMLTHHTHYVFNKPRKVESTNLHYTSSSLQNKNPKRTTKDYISQFYPHHIFSIGRLDYHTSGVLLFTTDGNLSYRLMHPKYQIKRKYTLTTKHQFPPRILNKWKNGIVIQGARYTLLEYTILNASPHSISLVMTEGKNHEIRIICDAFNITIKRLHRTAYGPIQADTLKVGKIRALTQKEKKDLYKSVQMKPA